VTPNTFTGVANVKSGNVYLSDYSVAPNGLGQNYIFDHPAFGGELIIGETGGTVPANVYVQRNSQFPAGCDVTVNGSGTLLFDRPAVDTNRYYSDHTDEVFLENRSRSLTLNGGEIYLGNSVWVSSYFTDTGIIAGVTTNKASLKVESNLVSTTTSLVYGPGTLSLYGCSSSVASNQLLIASSSEGFNKSGFGTLTLLGANTQTDLTISEGLGTIISPNVSILYHLVVSNAAELDITQPCTLEGQLELHGRGISGNGGALTVESSGVLWQLAPTFNINDDAAINVVNPTDQLTIMAASWYAYVTGTNDLYKLGAGTLQFADFSPNSHVLDLTNTFVDLSKLYTGTLYVQGGTVEFNSAYPPPAGFVAYSSPTGFALIGPIVIGTNGSTVSCTVLLDGPGQLNTNVSITINDGCHLNMSGYGSQTIGSLTLNGGFVGSLGNFVLGSNVTANFATYQPVISSDLSLGGAYRTFTVGSNTTLSVQGSIADGGNSAGIIKAGTGELQLTSPNPYGGSTFVDAGRLGLYGQGTPGSASSWTIVNSGGELDLEGGVNVNQALLSLAGNGADGNGALKGSGQNSWSGPVGSTADLTVNVASNGAIVLNGPLTCNTGGLTKTGLGTLEFAGSSPNSWGSTFVQQGALWLTKTNAIAVPGALVVGTGSGAADSVQVKVLQPSQLAQSNIVNIASSGLLDITLGSITRVGSITGSGSVQMGSSMLMFGYDNSSTAFGGSISGTADLTKVGTGTWTYTGTGSYSGNFGINSGQVFVDGSLASAAIFSYAGTTLGGSGSVGPITCFTGLLTPGDNDPGILNSGSMTLGSGATLLDYITGTNAGTGYSQLNFSGGTISLNNAHLQLNMSVFGATNAHYTLIHNPTTHVISGTFSGLAEGATVTANNGVHFTITYHGGPTGNDVVLTQTTLPTPPNLTGITQRTNGNVTIAGTGAPNVTYHVQATANLAPPNWVTLGSVTADGLGALVFTDSQAALFAERFYRFVFP
jgi:autotransporter-associated beta strand protein